MPGFPIFWRSRVADLTLVLDSLPELEARLPLLAGRLDPGRVAVVGHSGGGHTAGLLLGARIPGQEELREPRVKAGVLMAATGNGGADLTAWVRGNYPEMNVDYSSLTTRTLVVYGDQDVSEQLTVRGADWHADAYHHGPGADALLTMLGAKHHLGGVVGWDLKETDDADPDRLEITRRMTWAYLRSALYDGDPAWTDARKALAEHAASYGTVETKPKQG